MYDRELDDIANAKRLTLPKCPDCWRSGDERLGCNCLTTGLVPTESGDSDD